MIQSLIHLYLRKIQVVPDATPLRGQETAPTHDGSDRDKSSKALRQTQDRSSRQWVATVLRSLSQPGGERWHDRCSRVQVSQREPEPH